MPDDDYREELWEDRKSIEADAKFQALPHMTAPTEQLILELLSEHENENRPVKQLQKTTFTSQYCGEMSFEIETRFGFLTLHVFNDCDEWDYIERITFRHTTYFYPSFYNAKDRPWMTEAVCRWKPRKEHDPRWGEPSF